MAEVEQVEQVDQVEQQPEEEQALQTDTTHTHTSLRPTNPAQKWDLSAKVVGNANAELEDMAETCTEDTIHVSVNRTQDLMSNDQPAWNALRRNEEVEGPDGNRDRRRDAVLRADTTTADTLKTSLDTLREIGNS
jgi:hypothetical protein